MSESKEFFLDIPYTINGVEQFCDECKEPIFVGDYIRKVLIKKADLLNTRTATLCKSCLLSHEFSLGPQIRLVQDDIEDDIA
jgi:RNase P subunit RPR2